MTFPVQNKVFDDKKDLFKNILVILQRSWLLAGSQKHTAQAVQNNIIKEE